ncbi:MAG: hypothetical protein ACXVB0_21155 [Mucilaginibacter sp.]
MKFRFEDFLKNIIPGIILLIGITVFLVGDPSQLALTESNLHTVLKEYSELVILLFLVLAYLVGYINDGLSSWLEYYSIYYFLGTPALKLLRGKGKRISLVLCTDILKYLQAKESLSDEAIDIDKGTWFYQKNFRLAKDRVITLFKHANNLKDSNPQSSITEKIKDYYYAYIFSRNLFFSTLFSAGLIIITFHSSLSLKGLITLALVIIFLGIRRRDRAYYYTRNILLACKY